MIRKLLEPIRRADAWLTAETPNASGRLGLFRILYALFYLWYLATQTPSMISLLPRFYFDNRILLLRGWPSQPPMWFIQLLESLLTGLLVLLLFGLRTRLVTSLVIVVGLVLEGYITTVDPEQGNILMVFFIPCFMLLAGHWGDAYSVDRHIKVRAGLPAVDPRAPSASFMASRLLLVFLSIQFVISGCYKLDGTWLSHPRLLGNLMLSTSIDAAYYGIFVNPFARFIADTPIIYHGLQWFALVFECFFFVCLFGRIPRVLILSAALIFHSLNAILMWVTFTTIMIVYGAFMDWQSLFDRLGLGRCTDRVTTIPSPILIATALVLALLTGLLWNEAPLARGIFTLGGLVDFQTIWIPIPFIALYWLGSVLLLPRERRSW